jgi:hypothetical protein
MLSAARVLALCLGCVFTVFSFTPDEVLQMDAVIEDFSNRFGDKDDQNSFGAAKGVIEYGEGKAYSGAGYWYAAADDGSSVTNADGTAITKKITSAIETDGTDRYLHVIFTTSTSPNPDDDKYAVIGFNLTTDKEYTDVSKATGISVTAKGTGTIRVNFITEDYIDAGSEGTWGFYGFPLALTATKSTKSIDNADIEPKEWSYGYENDLTWVADGSKALTKVQIEVEKDENDDADLYLYEIKFNGVTYSDFGFVKVPVVFAGRQAKQLSGLSVNQSRITYSVEQPQNVSINLFDVAGCRVSNLFSGKAATGLNVLPVNFAGMQGVSAGKYIVRLDGTGISASQPVTITE